METVIGHGSGRCWFCRIISSLTVKLVLMQLFAGVCSLSVRERKTRDNNNTERKQNVGRSSKGDLQSRRAVYANISCSLASTHYPTIPSVWESDLCLCSPLPWGVRQIDQVLLSLITLLHSGSTPAVSLSLSLSLSPAQSCSVPRKQKHFEAIFSCCSSTR